MKKILKTFPIILLTLAPATSCNNVKSSNWPREEVYKYTYADMDPNRFPISGWVAPTNVWDSNTDEQYKILEEAGFTSIYGLYEKYTDDTPEVNYQVYDALKFASNHNIKYFVNDKSIWNYDGEEFAQKFKERNYTSYPGFGGLFYKDEPTKIEQFIKIGDDYQKFLKYVPNKYGFIVNNIASSSFKTLDDYIHFMDEFKKTVGLPYYSFDFYPTSMEFPFVKPNHFTNLNVVANWAKDNEIPFWAFALSTPHSFDGQEMYYRMPTERDIYWQVNTNLAYGAKGLTYFCYQTPVDWGVEHYEGKGGSFINEKGQKTQVYYYGKNINTYIHSIEHILMNMTKIGMLKHETGKMNAPLAGDFVNSIREITSLECNQDILVSVFDYGGKTVCYCVNTSLMDNANFRLNFIDNYCCNLYPMGANQYTVTNNFIQAELEPGRALLIEFK